MWEGLPTSAQPQLPQLTTIASVLTPPATQTSFEPRPQQLNLADAPERHTSKSGDRVKHTTLGEGEVVGNSDERR